SNARHFSSRKSPLFMRVCKASIRGKISPAKGVGRVKSAAEVQILSSAPAKSSDLVFKSLLFAIRDEGSPETMASGSFLVTVSMREKVTRAGARNTPPPPAGGASPRSGKYQVRNAP
ncbi:MAG: hypothetical protein J5449_12775, partial [Oscillospiraceae bacterium]|nr:hypothetical protein [Oscillospiraceae bacterium]